MRLYRFLIISFLSTLSRKTKTFIKCIFTNFSLNAKQRSCSLVYCEMFLSTLYVICNFKYVNQMVDMYSHVLHM